MTDTWRDQANCLGTYGIYHMPQPYKVTNRQTAAKYCRACAVQTDCYQYSQTLKPSDRYGVWGGIMYGDADRPSYRNTTGTNIL